MEGAAALGEVLERERQARGWTFRDVEHRLWARLDDDTPTPETIRTWHRGQVTPEHGNVLVASALAAIYELRLSELSPVLADRYRRALDLLSALSPCITDIAAHRVRRSTVAKARHSDVARNAIAS